MISTCIFAILREIHKVSVNIKEIFDYSGKYVFATAAVKEAGKTLPNGMNAHATVQPEEWWRELFKPYEGRFTLDFTTKKPTKKKKY